MNFVNLGRRIRTVTLAFAIGCFGVLAAHEHRFAFATESLTIPKGHSEIELASTHRIGRSNFYSAMDSKVEYEMGLTDRFMLAFSLRNTFVHSVSSGVESKAFSAPSFAVEAKGKILDPVADAIGLGLYGELYIKPHEVELEGKVILDKKIGPLLLVANGVVEQEAVVNAQTQAWSFNTKVLSHLGCSVDVGPMGIGMEGRTRAIWSGMTNLTQHTVYLGPALSFRHDLFWLSLTALIQIGDFNKPSFAVNGSSAEQVEARLQVGIPIGSGRDPH